jgi:hypothetical protein
MVISPDQQLGQNHYIKTHYIKYLATLKNKNSIHEEIKSRPNSWNACYHSVQNLLSFSLLSKNIQIKVYETIISPVILYGCETWSLTLREKHRLRKILGPKRGEVIGQWGK